jgi:hypothetical protein
MGGLHLFRPPKKLFVTAHKKNSCVHRSMQRLGLCSLFEKKSSHEEDKQYYQPLLGTNQMSASFWNMSSMEPFI